MDYRFHDLTSDRDGTVYLDPNNYEASQTLARQLRAEGSAGIIYPSVRQDGGLCLAAFWPDVIGIPIQGRHFAYHFNGTVIDMYRDETTGEVFKLITA